MGIYNICDRVELKRKKTTYGIVEAIRHLGNKTTYDMRLDNGVWLKYVKPKQIKGRIK